MPTPAAQPHPLDGVDDLGEAVMQGLARPIGYKQAPRPFRTFITGLISFGFAPVLRWQRAFLQYATLEQQQLWHLADWVRRSGRVKEGEALIRAADTINWSTPLPLLIFACLGYVAWAFYGAVAHHFSIPWLLDVTYGFPLSRHWEFIAADPTAPFPAWTLGLTAAYLLHFAQIQLHKARVRRFLVTFNKLADAAKLRRVPTTMGSDGAPPALLWFVGGVALVYYSAVWGAVMMFAAAAQHRLIRYASTVYRRELALRLRQLMLAGRPNADVVTPVNLRALCPNELCRATLKPGTRFCPRCGRPLSTAA